MSHQFIPKSAKELFDRMCNTPHLCGKFELVDNTIFWDVFNDITIEISINPPSTCISINRKLFKRISDSMTHWHPECEDVYQEILNIGTEGNVLVIRKNLLFDSVIYMGKEENCPYPSTIKRHFGKIYYLKAQETSAS